VEGVCVDAQAVAGGRRDCHVPRTGDGGIATGRRDLDADGIHVQRIGGDVGAVDHVDRAGIVVRVGMDAVSGLVAGHVDAAAGAGIVDADRAAVGVGVHAHALAVRRYVDAAAVADVDAAHAVGGAVGGGEHAGAIVRAAGDVERAAVGDARIAGAVDLDLDAE